MSLQQFMLSNYLKASAIINNHFSNYAKLPVYLVPQKISCWASNCSEFGQTFNVPTFFAAVICCLSWSSNKILNQFLYVKSLVWTKDLVFNCLVFKWSQMVLSFILNTSVFKSFAKSINYLRPK